MSPPTIRAGSNVLFSNLGPGAVRGLNRLFCRPLKSKPNVNRCIVEMQELMDALSRSHDANALKGHTLQMRDVEHSLCEFDKYSRVSNGEGRPRSKYHFSGAQ